MTISLKKQKLLMEDAHVVSMLFRKAVEQFGKEFVVNDPTTLWDVRCQMGVANLLPFGSTTFTNIEEMLWIYDRLRSPHDR